MNLRSGKNNTSEGRTAKFKGTEGSGSIVSRRSPKWLALGMKERVE